MIKRSLGLFPAEDPADEVTVTGLLDLEIHRVALGLALGRQRVSKADAPPATRIALDVDNETLDAIEALASAVGSTRRTLATRLLAAACWEAVNDLATRGGQEPGSDYSAALTTYRTASRAISLRRKKAVKG